MTTTFLNKEQLFRYAPSIYAEQPYEKMSSKYQFYSTPQLLDTLANEGWLPFKAMESRTRIPGKAGFQKHLIRLAKPDLQLDPNNQFNIVLINSHDGGCAYQLMAGVFRLICSNGLILGDQACPPIRFKHMGTTANDVVEAQVKILDSVPAIADSIHNMQSIILTEQERIAFARSALQLRWESEEREVFDRDNNKVMRTIETAPIKAEQLLWKRRYDDDKHDLYTTMNVVQENLMRGGLNGRTKQGGRTHTRAVNGVDANIKLNKALWTLTEEMAKLKV